MTGKRATSLICLVISSFSCCILSRITATDIYENVCESQPAIERMAATRLVLARVLTTLGFEMGYLSATLWFISSIGRLGFSRQLVINVVF